MAEKKVGELIKEARTNAKLSQTALAEQVGLSAADIGKAERGEKELSQAALKAIAKATGVTQKSLLEAPKGGASAAAATAKKTTATTAKKTATTAKKTTTTAKKTTTTAKKTGTATAQKTAAAEELTAAEKTMLNAYRKADAETRKAALKLLKGEKDEDILSTLIQSFTGGGSGAGDLGGGLMSLLGNLGKK
ncbi:MAG: helix-turn-helix transcriptional regulator [Oscillospiraceae bacterium]|nr:helix-turn-helix transcriptional regulator [Oscillospiraceae bacterium]